MSYVIMSDELPNGILPISMAKGLSKTPNFSTVRQPTAAGITYAVALKPYPTWDFELSLDRILGNEALAASIVAAFLGTYMATAGGANPFLFTDPQDYTATAQQFGTGNGTTTAFQLSRNIGISGVDVIQNVNGSPSIYKSGTLVTSGYSISATGVVTFTTAPASAAALTWTGSFYFLCRFAEDTLDAIRAFTTNSGTDQWDIQSIKFSSEFAPTTNYGTIY